MSLEWKSISLGSCCNFQEGYVNPSQKNPEYFDGDIKWIRAVDLNDGYVYETSRTLTQEGYESAGKSALLFKPNTIVISKSGTVGRLGIIKDYMCGNRATINIVPHKDVSMKFIFYVLKNYQRHFKDMAVGSVQKNLYVSILENLEISLPPKDTQKKIALILSNIDDKIDCIQKINKNLEEQIETIYNSFFVYYDDYSQEELEECEIGLIPKEWKLLSLGK
ncbi:MAG: restriction endonuclease subunit S, partial [Methanobrevibacter sp.]|nr:restriction endonuclease subunit S [Methanobrevibacter sp.]